jgi:hypothetical protein
MVPLLSVLEPLNVPSRATVKVPLSHHGALGPETTLLKFQVPVRSARDCPSAADGSNGDRQIMQVKMKSPDKCFERFALRIQIILRKLPGRRGDKKSFLVIPVIILMHNALFSPVNSVAIVYGKRKNNVWAVRKQG